LRRNRRWVDDGESPGRNFNMKKPKRDNWRDEIRKSRASYFPEDPAEMSEEDRALEMLLMGIRLGRRFKNNPIPAPLTLYGPAMEMYFEWIAREITEKENQYAAERLYHLALFSVKALGNVCGTRPEFFRPIARHQLIWPCFTGWGKDSERMNSELMKFLNLGEASPLNSARDGRKSFSLLEGTGTYIAYQLWLLIEYFRRDEQEISSFEPSCSLVLPDLPGIRDVRKTGLSDAQIEKLKTISPLSRQNFLEWWELGESAFIHHYGKDFENHKDFSSYWKNQAFKGDPKARAKIRSAIKKQIKQAFRSIAPKSSIDEKQALASK